MNTASFLLERMPVALGASVLLALLQALFERALGPHIWRWQRRFYERRRATRLARGSDRYFEELRAIETNAPPQEYPWRPFGNVMLRKLPLAFLLSCLVLSNPDVLPDAVTEWMTVS